MARKKIAFGVGAGVVSTVVDGVAGLSNVHFLNRYLPGTASGYWMLCITVGGFLVLAQSSLVPVVARLTAQHLGNVEHWNRILGQIRRLVNYLVRLQLVASVLVYGAYLYPAGRNQNLGFQGLGVWLTYAVGLACSLDASARFAVLNGYGEVGWDKVTRIGTGIAGALLTWLSLWAGWGLMGLSLTLLLQGVVTMFLAEGLLRRHQAALKSGGSSTSPAIPVGDAGPAVPLFSQLAMESGKLLGLAFLGYLITSFGAISIERQLGLEVLNQYGALNRIGILLVGVASLVPQMFYPFVARAWSEGRYRLHRRFVLGGLGIAVGIYASLALIIWLLAPILGPLWLGKERYLGSEVLGWILLSYSTLVIGVAVVTPVLASTGKAFGGMSIVHLFLTLPTIWWFTSRLGVRGAPIGFLLGSVLPTAWILLRCWQLMLHHGKSERVVADLSTGVGPVNPAS